MPINSYQRRCFIRIPSKSQIPKAKISKSYTSQEFDEFERYYDIENDENYAFRKEHYVVDEFLFKSKNMAPKRKKSPMQVDPKCYVTPRSIDCFINQSYPRYEELRTSAGPLKNMDFNFADEDTKEDKVDSAEVRMDWNNYHRLGVIHNFLEELEYDLPSLCTTGIIGKSLEGRDLKILKISNSDATNASVWIDAGIHAREWIAPAVNTYVANHIARNFDNMPASVRNKDWYFLPVLNPDGYEYTHTTNRMWRKNKACIREQLFGVDLNRNFSLGWGGKGSSDEPTHSFYRGPRPFSEPESSAVRDIFMKSGVTFKVYITLHSFGQVIIMPFAYRDDLAPDYIRLLEGATAMSKAIYNTNGNTYKVGISKDVMYQASGTSNDWSHGAVGIPYCYLIELRSKKHKFKLPKEEIAETGAEILSCVIALMDFVDNYKSPKIIKHIKETSEEKGDIGNVKINEAVNEDKENENQAQLKPAQIDVTSFQSETSSEVDSVQLELQAKINN